MTSLESSPPAFIRSEPLFKVTQLVCLLLAGAGFFLPYAINMGLNPIQQRMFGIFIAAVVLWLTEAIPMHATAIVIILLEVLLLSDKGFSSLPGIFKMPLPEGFKAIPYAAIFATLSDPIIMLFLGGFVLADCAAKYKLDKNLSRVILKPFGTKPAFVLLGLMLVTAVFSMFMSNTATTATMMTIALPVIMQLPKADRMRAAIALAIPAAANIGGIGTPVGTPPNAIALGALAAAGHKTPSFMLWMLGAVPFVILFLAVAWVTFLVLFPTKEKNIKLNFEGAFDKSPRAIIFYSTFILTILLWMTESLHGINSNVVGFLPVAVLLFFRVFSVEDVKKLDWHVLWLVAGGIAIGLGVSKTGLDRWFIDLFNWKSMSPTQAIALLTLASLTMGTFMSHSATSNLLVPIAIALATSVPSLNPVGAAIWVAVGSSLAMSLPISTPPNAIAFSTGEVKVRDMAIVGIIIGAIGWLAFVTIAPTMWKYIGILP